jgi:hypothetical protein
LLTGIPEAVHTDWHGMPMYLAIQLTLSCAAWGDILTREFADSDKAFILVKQLVDYIQKLHNKLTIN